MNLANTKQLTMSEPCPNCGATDSTTSEKDIVNRLRRTVTNGSGQRMEVISSKTEEGIQLASLGGVSGILSVYAKIIVNFSGKKETVENIPTLSRLEAMLILFFWIVPSILHA